MWCCCGSVAAVSAKESKPNIILIVADDAGYADFSYLGSQSYEDPRIDELVAGGVHFTNMHVSASVSGPSRWWIYHGALPTPLRK